MTLRARSVKRSNMSISQFHPEPADASWHTDPSRKTRRALKGPREPDSNTSGARKSAVDCRPPGGLIKQRDALGAACPTRANLALSDNRPASLQPAQVRLERAVYVWVLLEHVRTCWFPRMGLGSFCAFTECWCIPVQNGASRCIWVRFAQLRLGLTFRDISARVARSTRSPGLLRSLKLPAPRLGA